MTFANRIHQIDALLCNLDSFCSQDLQRVTTGWVSPRAGFASGTLAEWTEGSGKLEVSCARLEYSGRFSSWTCGLEASASIVH